MGPNDISSIPYAFEKLLKQFKFLGRFALEPYMGKVYVRRREEKVGEEEGGGGVIVYASFGSEIVVGIVVLNNLFFFSYLEWKGNGLCE